MPESVVLLHGFGGTRHTWDLVSAHLDAERYLPLALDLPGHGSEGHEAEELTFATCVEHVLARAPQRFALCGYSLGGRIALHVAVSEPDRVERLVLVSSTAGIEDEREREERRRADSRLVEQLEGEPYERFIERWRAQPLFAGEPALLRELAMEDQRRNRPEALARVLRGLGTGEMTPLWGRLGELTMPVSVIAGERDAKFLAIGARMAELLPHGRLVMVPGGHALALENPKAVALVLEGRDP